MRTCDFVDLILCLGLARKSFERDLILLSLIEICLGFDIELVECENRPILVP